MAARSGAPARPGRCRKSWASWRTAIAWWRRSPCCARPRSCRTADGGSLRCPGPWISSLTSRTPYRWASATSAASSSAVWTRPTGLSGLHSTWAAGPAANASSRAGRSRCQPAAPSGTESQVSGTSTRVRRGDQHGAAWAGEYAQQLDHADADVDHRRDRRRVDLPGPPAPCEGSEGLAEPGGGDGVPGVRTRHGLLQHHGDRRGQRVVHLGDGQRQHVRRVGAPLRAATASQPRQRLDHQLLTAAEAHVPAVPGHRRRDQPTPGVRRRLAHRGPPVAPAQPYVGACGQPCGLSSQSC